MQQVPPLEIAKPIVRYVLEQLVALGHELDRVEYDDEDGEDVSTLDEAIEEVLAVDYSTVLFKDGNWLVLIPENGEDVVCDWNCSPSPALKSEYDQHVETVLKELRHCVCGTCGSVFHESQLQKSEHLFDKTEGRPNVYETSAHCPKCGSEGWDEVVRAPATSARTIALSRFT